MSDHCVAYLVQKRQLIFFTQRLPVCREQLALIVHDDFHLVDRLVVLAVSILGINGQVAVGIQIQRIAFIVCCLNGIVIRIGLNPLRLDGGDKHLCHRIVFTKTHQSTGLFAREHFFGFQLAHNGFSHFFEIIFKFLLVISFVCFLNLLIVEICGVDTLALQYCCHVGDIGLLLLEHRSVVGSDCFYQLDELFLRLFGQNRRDCLFRQRQYLLKGLACKFAVNQIQEIFLAQPFGQTGSHIFGRLFID